MDHIASYTTEELIHELLESNRLAASPGIDPSMAAIARSAGTYKENNYQELLRSEYHSPICSCDLGCICMIHHYQNSGSQSAISTE